MHLTRMVALGAIVLSAAVGVACGTSSHPPLSDPTPVVADAGGKADAGQTPLFADASPDDPYYDCYPVDAGGGSCPCKNTFALPVVSLVCGYGICTDLPSGSSYCTPDGHLIRLSVCDLDAGFAAIPACAPGTHPLPPR